MAEMEDSREELTLRNALDEPIQAQGQLISPGQSRTLGTFPPREILKLDIRDEHGSRELLEQEVHMQNKAKHLVALKGPSGELLLKRQDNQGSPIMEGDINEMETTSTSSERETSSAISSSIPVELRPFKRKIAIQNQSGQRILVNKWLWLDAGEEKSLGLFKVNERITIEIHNANHLQLLVKFVKLIHRGKRLVFLTDANERFTLKKLNAQGNPKLGDVNEEEEDDAVNLEDLIYEAAERGLPPPLPTTRYVFVHNRSGRVVQVNRRLIDREEKAQLGPFPVGGMKHSIEFIGEESGVSLVKIEVELRHRSKHLMLMREVIPPRSGQGDSSEEFMVKKVDMQGNPKDGDINVDEPDDMINEEDEIFEHAAEVANAILGDSDQRARRSTTPQPVLMKNSLDCKVFVNGQMIRPGEEKMLGMFCPSAVHTFCVTDSQRNQLASAKIYIANMPKALAVCRTDDKLAICKLDDGETHNPKLSGNLDEYEPGDWIDFAPELQMTQGGECQDSSESVASCAEVSGGQQQGDITSPPAAAMVKQPHERMGSEPFAEQLPMMAEKEEHPQVGVELTILNESSRRVEIDGQLVQVGERAHLGNLRGGGQHCIRIMDELREHELLVRNVQLLTKPKHLVLLDVVDGTLTLRKRGRNGMPKDDDNIDEESEDDFVELQHHQEQEEGQRLQSVNSSMDTAAIESTTTDRNKEVAEDTPQYEMKSKDLEQMASETLHKLSEVSQVEDEPSSSGKFNSSSQSAIEQLGPVFQTQLASDSEPIEDDFIPIQHLQQHPSNLMTDKQSLSAASRSSSLATQQSGTSPSTQSRSMMMEDVNATQQPQQQLDEEEEGEFRPEFRGETLTGDEGSKQGVESAKQAATEWLARRQSEDISAEEPTEQEEPGMLESAEKAVIQGATSQPSGEAQSSSGKMQGDDAITQTSLIGGQVAPNNTESSTEQPTTTKTEPHIKAKEQQPIEQVIPIQGAILTEKAEQFMQKVAPSIVTDAAKGAATTASKVADTTKHAAQTVADTAKGAATMATDTVKGAATMATDTAKGAAALAAGTAMGAVAAATESTWQAVSTAAETAKSTATSVLDTAKQTTSSPIESTEELSQKDMATFSEGLKQDETRSMEETKHDE